MEAMMADSHAHHAHHGAHASNPIHGAHGLHGADGGQGATGTIRSISGTSFVVATKQGDVTVATDAATNFHTPGVARAAKQAGYDGYHDLIFAALEVGQRVGVMGDRLDDATLLARRVHLPKP
jgi:hypothetical protein